MKNFSTKIFENSKKTDQNRLSLSSYLEMKQKSPQYLLKKLNTIDSCKLKR